MGGARWQGRAGRVAGRGRGLGAAGGDRLRAGHATLRGVITETSPRPDWQWLIFAYVVRDFDGELTDDHREGRLRWWPLRDRTGIPMPEADQQFFDPVVLGTGGPYECTFHYDAELRLLGTGSISLDGPAGPAPQS